MARDAELRAKITADDQASDVIEGVAEAAERLEDEQPQVTVGADTADAEAGLDETQSSVDDLDGAEAEVAVTADADDATSQLDETQTAVDDLDGAQAEVAVEADAEDAVGQLDDVQSAVESLDGSEATVTAKVDDQASSGLGDLVSGFEQLGKEAGGLPGPLGEITSILGKLGGSAAGPAAGVAALAGAFAMLASKGIQQFQELGLAVSEFSTVTGASLDAASRLIEVSNDLGVSSDTTEAAIAKMNRAAENSPERFAAMGAEIVRTQDGALDSVGTFESVVGALNGISDGGERAKAGMAIFGKSWTSMSALIEEGADGVKRRMQEVSDAKLFDAAKVQQAKELRDAFDTISDATDDLKLSLAQGLAPAISRLAPMLARVVDSMTPLVTMVGDELATALEAVLPLINAVTESLQAWTSLEIHLPGDKELKPFAGALTLLGESMDVMREKFGSSPELAAGFDVSASAAQAQADAVRDAAEAADELAAQQAKAEATLFDYIKTLNSTDFRTSDIDSAAKAWGELGEQQFALQDISAGVQQAYDDLGAAVRDNGLTFDVTTEAGRKNADQIKQLYSSLIPQLSAAFADSGGNIDTFGRKMDGLRSQVMQQLGEQAGLTGDQVQAIIDQLGVFDGSTYSSTFEMLGVADANAKLALLSGVLGSLPPDVQRQVTLDVLAGDPQAALDHIDDAVHGHPLDTTVDVDADTSEATDDIDHVTTAKHTTTVKTDADTARADADLLALITKPREARIYPGIYGGPGTEAELDRIAASREARVNVSVYGVALANQQIDSIVRQQRTARIDVQVVPTNVLVRVNGG